jgi:hypothetical protein
MEITYGVIDYKCALAAAQHGTAEPAMVLDHPDLIL